jgi:pimeloyl-ACP methyl ester carboxylesterase
MHSRRLTIVGGLFSLLLATTSVAHAGPVQGTRAAQAPPDVELEWEACGTTPEAEAADVECARAPLPLDYDDPEGEQIEIAVGRVPAADPAQRIGSLFFNFGGPGGPAVDYVQAAGAGVFASLNQYFDIVAFDPRGVGQSTPAIDCELPPASGSPSLPTPLDIDVDAVVADAQDYVDACLDANGDILEHVSTANVARDMDALRAAVGDEQLSYLGFSYGTLIGATYASLFPDNYRAMVLDGAIDPDQYLNDPALEQSTLVAGFEDALDRFLDACAADQLACSGFGGADPLAAYDALLGGAEATPIPVLNFPEDPTPVTADEIRLVTFQALYAKEAWGVLALALAEAEQGDASIFRELIILLSGGDPAFGDRFFAISAGEQQWPTDIDAYLERGAEEWTLYPHFWFLGSYNSIPYALWPAHDEDAFTGPFAADPSAPPVLVVGNSHDPATPYSGAVALTEQLGNARLLTMDGDGHTAYGGKSACIDSATDSYLVSGTLPAEGTVCPHEVPFESPAPAPAPPVEASVPTAAIRPVGVLTGG